MIPWADFDSRLIEVICHLRRIADALEESVYDDL